MPIFLLSAFGWLKNSWLGKAVAIAGAVLMALWLARRSGAKAAQAQEQIRKAEAAQDMKEIRDEVESLPDADRRDELGRFVRRDK